MATSYKSRSGSNWRSSGRSSSTGRRTSTSRKTGTSCAPGYSNVYNCFQTKVTSYRTLANQTRGTSSGSRPSPATLKSFGTWIEKGANIQTVSSAQLKRWCGKTNAGKWNWNSPTSTKNFLWSKFGKGCIKAVAKSKTGSFIVATASSWKGKSFCFPKY